MKIIAALASLLVFVGGVFYVNRKNDDEDKENKGEESSKNIPESVFKELPQEKQDRLVEEGYTVIPGA